jgi:hypothetical protein
MSRVKATFYLPLVDNDGRDLSLEIAQVEDSCYLAFGAWTAAGFFKGAWRMGTGYRRIDTSAVYVVIIDEDRLVDLEGILREFKGRTTQEAIYLEVQRDVDLRFI